MSENYACPKCDFSLPELEPRIFSFNAPYGACPTCKGLGITKHVSLDLLIPDKNLSNDKYFPLPSLLGHVKPAFKLTLAIFPPNLFLDFLQHTVPIVFTTCFQNLRYGTSSFERAFLESK